MVRWKRASEFIALVRRTPNSAYAARATAQTDPAGKPQRRVSVFRSFATAPLSLANCPSDIPGWRISDRRRAATSSAEDLNATGALRSVMRPCGQTYGRTRSPKSLIVSMILPWGGPPE